MYLFRKNVITDIIESVDDWLIFGTVQFGRPTTAKFAIDIFYKLIRSIEKKSGSVWLLKLEGDNITRNIHIHFIISQDGYILTNHHVVEDASEVIISLQDRREFSAEIIGSFVNLAI